MNYIIGIALALVLFSCNSGERNTPYQNPSKLVSSFQPAFHEFSEVTFDNRDTAKRLSILIRKNYRLDATQDTFYYKSVVLDKKGEALLQGAVLSRFPLHLPEKQKALILDGIPISYHLIHNTDTTLYQFHSPSPTWDSVAYNLTLSALDAYQSLLRDTVVSDYFNELRVYLDDKRYVKPTTMTRLKQLRELKYAGLMKYSR